MSTLRRRLRLADSSSDEDEPAAVNCHHHQPPQSNSTSNSDPHMFEAEAVSAAENLASTTLNPIPNPSHNFPSPPLEDFGDVYEEFIDVSEDLSPPAVEEMPTPMSGGRAAAAAEGVGSATGEVLRRLGMRVREEWLRECVRALERSVIGFGGFGVEKRAEFCFGQVLMADLNLCGGGILPENVAGMHLVDLAGPFVLQVDEIMNMSCPLRQRYQKAAPGSKRCLKLSMTDGVQRVVGMEYRPIKDLDVLSPAGIKVAIRNVQTRHGILMLVPEVIEVLGGMVEDLEAAHQRLVSEINKPPRGRRPRMGDVPPLATRATLAAWLATDVNGPVQSENPRPQGPGPFQTAANVSGPDQVSHSRRPTGVGGPTQAFHSGAQATGFPQHCPSRTDEVHHLPTRATPSTFPSVGSEHYETFYFRSQRSVNASCPNQTSDSVPDHNQTVHFRSQHSDSLQTPAVKPSGPDQTLHSGVRNEGSFHSAQEDTEATTGNHAYRLAINDMHNEINLGATRPNGSSSTFIDLDFDMYEDRVETIGRTAADNDPFSTPNEDVRDTVMVDEVEYPVILDGDKEIPFTYLSSLSAKLSATENTIASVQGKIKCFLTGVKGFQYKDRSTYELQAYVDDGSLISEILIHHSVVLNGIGYTPAEVNAALSSSDSNVVSQMKESMKQFQIFLVNFEGTMLLKLNRSSSTPVAIEMNQGCLASDAWSLLRRFKSFTTIQTPRHFSAEPIDVSP